MKGSVAPHDLRPTRSRGATGSHEMAPMVLVAPSSFVPAARQLVASAVRNAKNAKLDPNGGAVIVSDAIGDTFIRDRKLAVRDAIEANGIDTIVDVVFSKSVETGAHLLAEQLNANPKLVLVFALDGSSTAAARQVMAELIPERLFVQSAFAAEGNYGDMTRAGDFAAVAGFIPNRILRKAVSTAISLSRGRDVPNRVEVPVEVQDSDESASTPKSPAFYKSKSSTKKK